MELEQNLVQTPEKQKEIIKSKSLIDKYYLPLK